MNAQNVKELEEKIRKVGFKDVMLSLVRRICFQPPQFVVCRILQKGGDKIVFHFHLRRCKETESYVLDYYDAVLQKETLPPEGVVNGIDIVLLEKRMAEINWKEVFRSGDTEATIRDETKMWTEAEEIESIIGDLARLEEGENDLASALKQKFWAGTSFQEFTGGSLSGKVKSEITQRFYVQDGSLISSDEACRFLQNRWLERELQIRRKAQKRVEESGREGKDDERLAGKRKRRRTISHQNK